MRRHNARTDRHPQHRDHGQAASPYIPPPPPPPPPPPQGPNGGSNVTSSFPSNGPTGAPHFYPHFAAAPYSNGMGQSYYSEQNNTGSYSAPSNVRMLPPPLLFLPPPPPRTGHHSPPRTTDNRPLPHAMQRHDSHPHPNASQYRVVLTAPNGSSSAPRVESQALEQQQPDNAQVPAVSNQAKTNGVQEDPPKSNETIDSDNATTKKRSFSEIAIKGMPFGPSPFGHGPVAPTENASAPTSETSPITEQDSVPKATSDEADSSNGSPPKKRPPRRDFLLAQAKLRKAELENQKALRQQAVANTNASVGPGGQRRSPMPWYAPRVVPATATATSLPPITALTEGALDSLVLNNIETSSDKVNFDTSQWARATLDHPLSNASVPKSAAGSTASSCGSPSPVPPSDTMLELQQKLQQSKETKQRLVAAKERRELLQLVQQRKQQLEEKARRLQETDKPENNGVLETTLDSNGADDNTLQSTGSFGASQFSDADDDFFTVDIPVPASSKKQPRNDSTLPSSKRENVESQPNDPDIAATVSQSNPTRAELLERKKNVELKREIVRFQSVTAKQERLLADQTKQVQQTTDHLQQSTERLAHAQAQLVAARRAIENETTRKAVLEELLAEYVSELVQVRKQLHDHCAVPKESSPMSQQLHDCAEPSDSPEDSQQQAPLSTVEDPPARSNNHLIHQFTEYYNRYTALHQEYTKRNITVVTPTSVQMSEVEWAKYHADLASRAAHYFHNNPNSMTVAEDMKLPPPPPTR